MCLDKKNQIKVMVSLTCRVTPTQLHQFQGWNEDKNNVQHCAKIILQGV